MFKLWSVADIWPVLVTLHSATLHVGRQHDDQWWTLLPNHLPEVMRCLRQRSLGSDVTIDDPRPGNLHLQTAGILPLLRTINKVTDRHTVHSHLQCLTCCWISLPWLSVSLQSKVMSIFVALYNESVLRYGPCSLVDHTLLPATHSQTILLYSPAAEYHRPLVGTHCVYPWRDSQAELTWMAG